MKPTKAQIKAQKANALEAEARKLLKEVHPRINVYQWFALALTGASSPTMVTVEIETKTYVASKPKSKDWNFSDQASWKAACAQHRADALTEAQRIIDLAKPVLNAAGITFRAWSDYGWPKLNLTIK